MKLEEIKNKYSDKKSFFKSDARFHGTTLRTYVWFIRTPDFKIYQVYMDNFLDEICIMGCDVVKFLEEKLESIGEEIQEKDVFKIESIEWIEV